MAVPNYKNIVEKVNNEYPQLLRYNSAAACGEFIQRVVQALPKGERWGLLSKSEGEAGYTFPNGQRCSYDYVAVPQGDRVDIIASAAGHDMGIVGGPSWVPAAEHEWRPSNVWVDVSSWPIYDSGVISGGTVPLYTGTVGFGWFCFQTALAEWPSEFEQNWAWLLGEMNPDCFRVMLAVEGESHGSPDVWTDAGVFINEDWDNRYKKMLDFIGNAGKQVHATVYGGRNQTPTEDDRRRFHDRIVAASSGRWQAIRSFEMMNEFKVNKWTAEEVRAAGRDLRSKIPANFLLSLSSPDLAHSTVDGRVPTNEEMQASFDELYGGSDRAGANEITIHLVRDASKWSDPYAYNYLYPGVPKINNEPRGPGSSAGGMYTDATVVYDDCTKTFKAGWTAYWGHSEWSVWNGHLPQQYYNGWREVKFVKDLPYMPEIAATLKSINAGVDPGPPPSPGPIPEPGPQPPLTYRGQLLSGQSLLPDESLHSPGGKSDLRYQGDGNLVVYLDGQPIWSSHTENTEPGSLQMQLDGNLVLQSATGPIRATRTHGHPGAMVQLQDDGNFVVYEDPTGPLAGTPLWASATDTFYGPED